MRGKREKKQVVMGILSAVLVLLIIYFWHTNSYVYLKDIL